MMMTLRASVYEQGYTAGFKFKKGRSFIKDIIYFNWKIIENHNLSIN